MQAKYSNTQSKVKEAKSLIASHSLKEVARTVFHQQWAEGQPDAYTYGFSNQEQEMGKQETDTEFQFSVIISNGQAGI